MGPVWMILKSFFQFQNLQVIYLKEALIEQRED